MRVRNHVNPLKVGYLGEGGYPRVRSLDLPASGEIEVELGCADAQFLFQRATANPSVSCIGVEIRDELVTDVNRRAAELGLGNLRAVFANVNTDLDGLFPDGRLARVFLNFPDPWFKRRHHKRRVLTPEVAATLQRQLALGGELLFQSDVFELALEAMAVLEEAAQLSNRHGPWSFLPASHDGHPYSARSLRDDRCSEKGMKIWRMIYVRQI